MEITSEGKTPSHLARQAEWKKVVEDCKSLGAKLNAKDRFGGTLLHNCSGKRLARILLEHGAQVDAQDRYGRTPLHYCRNTRLARILLDKGAPVDVRDESGLTPLIRMLSNKRDAAFIRSCFELIDEYGVKPDQSEQSNLLKEWVNPYNGFHDDDGFRELLKHGIDAKAKSDSGQTVLHYATQEGRASLVRVLKQYGIDVNAVDDNGRTLIHTLLDTFGNEPDVRPICNYMDVLLSDNPEIDVNIKDNRSRTPLVIAIEATDSWYCWKECSLIIRSLVNHGADISTPMYDPKSVFYKASRGAQSVFIGSIAKRGRITEIIDKHGNTALHAICKSFKLSFIKSLPLDGIDLNAVVNKLGETPLRLASKGCRAKTVSFLLNKGAGKLIDGRTFDGLTPLHMASVDSCCEETFKEVIARHLQQGLDIDARDKLGKTPLHYAIESQEGHKVKQLLNSGADVEAADEVGENSLYRAIKFGSIEVLQIILDSGVDVTARFFDGTTSLHLSIHKDKPDSSGLSFPVTYELLDHFKKKHLNPDLIREYDIHTPLYYAMQRSASLTKAFIRCGASIDKIYWTDGGKFLQQYNRDRCRIIGLMEDVVYPLRRRLYVANLDNSFPKQNIQAVREFVNSDADYKKQCLKEVEKLKRCKISGQMSYYDFLHTDDTFPAKAITNTGQGIDRVAADFPIYAGLIMSKIEADLYRINLLRTAADELFSYLVRSSYSSLPVVVISRILVLLNNDDLLRLFKPHIGHLTCNGCAPGNCIDWSSEDGEGYFGV